MAMTFKIYIVYSERWNHIGNMVHGSMTDLGWINKTDYKRKFTLLFSQIISIKECTQLLQAIHTQPATGRSARNKRRRPEFPSTLRFSLLQALSEARSYQKRPWEL